MFLVPLRRRDALIGAWIGGIGFTLLVLFALTFWHLGGKRPDELGRILAFGSLVSFCIWALGLLVVVVLLVLSAKSILTHKFSVRIFRRAKKVGSNPKNEPSNP